MFTDDVIDAMAETPERHARAAHAAAVRPDKVLMRSSYRSKKFLNILDKVRERIP